MLAAIETRVHAAGLVLRGGFHPAPGDAVPMLPDGRAVGTLILVGNAGPGMWRAFSASSDASVERNPLDAWTRRVVTTIAAAFDAAPLFPFDGPPHLPFQRWGQRAEAVHPSPIGLLIHPDYGLWHAYRGALAFVEVLPLPPRADAPHPCDSCNDRPCLTTCPVGAFTAAGYDVGACRRHVAGPAGMACRDGGCQARRACPVGQAFAYEPDPAAFHMRAFLGNRPR